MKVRSTLTVVIEAREDGAFLISTQGNPDGDWERRSAWDTGALRDALHDLDDATDSTKSEPVFGWWVKS